MEKRKRVLMLNYEYPPLGGGAGIATESLLEQFSGRDEVIIDLVTSSADKGRIETLSANVTIHYLDIGKDGKRLHFQSERDLLTYSFRAYRYAKSLMLNKKFDFIHAFFGVPCGFIAMLLNKPYIVSLRGSDVPFHNPRFYLMDLLVFRTLSRLVWNRAAFVIANSDTLIRSAARTLPGRIIDLVYNGVDTSLYRPDEKVKKDPGIFRILFVGRLGEVKGVRYLLEAFNLITAKYDRDNIQLWIVGDGRQRKELTAMAKRKNIDVRTRFFYRVPRRDVPWIYNKCDVLVLPSLNEGMPLTVVEAMAAGLGVVCTDLPSFSGLVEEGKNGFLVRRKNAADIFHALEKYYLGGRKMLREHGRLSMEIAAGYTWKAAADRYISFYEMMP